MKGPWAQLTTTQHMHGPYCFQHQSNTNQAAKTTDDNKEGTARDLGIFCDWIFCHDRRGDWDALDLGQIMRV